MNITNHISIKSVVFSTSIFALVVLYFWFFVSGKTHSAISTNTALAVSDSIIQSRQLPTPVSLKQAKYFGDVIDIKEKTIVGNFGEPRRAHFHTGLDFRTNQEEGHAVFAAADGYVSRINVSGTGYGNALYITHPNGYVTVYGHLLVFNATIQKRLREEQYKKESFAVDFQLSPSELVVKKGDTIALSGNTGGSGGPHLHFEIRDTLENVYNPMLFGYELKDDLKPVIGYVKFYPMDSLRYRSDGYRVRPTLKNGVYEFSTGVVKVNSKSVSLAINAYDIMNLTESHTGIYNLTLFDGDKMIYNAKFDKLSFPEKRYVYTHIDYPIFQNEGRKSFHKCFVEPGNKCGIYSDVFNAGEIDLSNGKVHELYAEATDFNGNVAQLKMKLQHDVASLAFKAKTESYTTRFDADTANEFSTTNFSIKVPNGYLFNHLFLSYRYTAAKDSTAISGVHTFGNTEQYLYDWCTVTVKPENLNTALKDKAILTVNGNSLGGKFDNGFITTRTRDLGVFQIKLDTTAPKIAALNVTTGKNMRVYKKLLFKISDNLSGIADFDTYLDGQWVVTDYDAKSNTITHTLDQKLKNGEHIFKVVVTDERKNQSQLEIKFLM